MKRILQFCRSALLTGLAASVLSTHASAQIEVTEVMFDATNNAVWQWIEVRNSGAAAVDLNGYLGFNLGDTDIVAGPNPTINSTSNPTGTTLEAGEVAVIYDGFYATNNPDNHNVQKFRDGWGLGSGVKVFSADFFPNFFNDVNPQGYSIGFWPDVTAWRSDMTPAGGGAGAVTTSFSNTAFGVDFSNFPVTSTVNGFSSITWTGNGDYKDGANWVQSVSGSNGAVTSSLVNLAGGDTGNPGVVTTNGTFPTTPHATTELFITEIMFNPIGSEPQFEWVEVYNNSATPVDLTGYVLDDTNSNAHAAENLPNISGGTVPAFGTAILYNALITQSEFENAWGTGLNVVPVTDWTQSQMSLNNSGADGVGLWATVAEYTGDNQAHANAAASLKYDLNSGWPLATNQSIYLTNRDNPTTDPFNWNAATAGVDGSISTGLKHPGGDVGSPGTFVEVTGTPGDFDGDGDVDGRDFLTWQRDPGVGDLADWQNNYGMGGGLAAIGSVPEPTALALLALALVPVACGRKR